MREYIMLKTRDPKKTSKIMSSIKSTNTKPELKLRSLLWGKGYRYRVNYKKLIGKPDIVFVRKKVVIFVDGDFWHGHNWAIRGLNSLEDELKQYSIFWKDKILRNIKRDEEVNSALQQEGWTVLRYWESDIKKNINHIMEDIIFHLTR
jgi:DNA mismatch endonuclease (patch repair protein)